MYENKHGTRCSTHLKIKSLQEFSGRRSTFVVAREVDTGVRLRCEVFIDKVHRLQLVQNTHLIYLESYAEATMQGYDMEGNMFSTLNGLEFKWDAQNRGEGTSPSMAAIMGYQPRVTLHPDQADLSILGARGVAVCFRFLLPSHVVALRIAAPQMGQEPSADGGTHPCGASWGYVVVLLRPSHAELSSSLVVEQGLGPLSLDKYDDSDDATKSNPIQ